MKFTIHGPPVGKARARVTRWGAYTPEKTINYENLVKSIYAYEIKGPVHTGPLKMRIEAYFEIPKAFSKVKRSEAEKGALMPTKKPDIDNIAKIICDSLNNIAYQDDTQVVELTVIKRFATDPRVEVEIEQI